MSKTCYSRSIANYKKINLGWMGFFYIYFLSCCSTSSGQLRQKTTRCLHCCAMLLFKGLNLAMLNLKKL